MPGIGIYCGCLGYPKNEYHFVTRPIVSEVNGSTITGRPPEKPEPYRSAIFLERIEPIEGSENE
jgi:hypothetical protein